MKGHKLHTQCLTQQQQVAFPVIAPSFRPQVLNPIDYGSWLQIVAHHQKTKQLQLALSQTVRDACLHSMLFEVGVQKNWEGYMLRKKSWVFRWYCWDNTE